MSFKIILYGAGSIGQQALNFYGIRNVYCFADTFKAGMSVCGKKVISVNELAEIHKDFKVVISNEVAFGEIAELLNANGIKFINYADDLEEYRKSAPPYNHRILKFKNKHKGGKVFLIGNGPSLRVTDLEAVSKAGYKTIACNFINKIFDATYWRPDYYCCVEESAIELNRDFIAGNPDIPKFIRGNLPKVYFSNDYENVYWFMQSKKCEISQKLEYIVYDYNTVMFTMIEFAMYMGFSGIYLLGVDNTQPPSVHTADFIEASTHFYDEEVDVLDKRRSIMGHLNFENDYQAYQKYCNEGYECAREYADHHGIVIKNATRGGKLEVFDRVCIDSLLAIEGEVKS